jgi:hypothetical protein
MGQRRNESAQELAPQLTSWGAAIRQPYVYAPDRRRGRTRVIGRRKMGERASHREGDQKQGSEPEAGDSVRSSAEEAKKREREGRERRGERCIKTSTLRRPSTRSEAPSFLLLEGFFAKSWREVFRGIFSTPRPRGQHPSRKRAPRDLSLPFRECLSTRRRESGGRRGDVALATPFGAIYGTCMRARLVGYLARSCVRR